MNLIDVVFLAVALAMDCFTVSIVSGLTTVRGTGNDSKGWLYRMALLFGGFQALMPLLGWLGVIHFQASMAVYNRWIAFVLLAFIGGKMVWESFSPEDEQHFDARRLRTQLLLAVATSIDALAVGVTFACTGYTLFTQLLMPLVIIGLTSLLFSLAGYHLGHRFGAGIAQRVKPELIGGLILIAIGLKILL